MHVTMIHNTRLKKKNIYRFNQLFPYFPFLSLSPPSSPRFSPPFAPLFLSFFFFFLLLFLFFLLFAVLFFPLIHLEVGPIKSS